MAEPPKIVLPPLREELAVYAGPTARSGEPTWTVHDPVRNLYFRIDWPTFEILCRWHFGDPDRVVASINQETTLELQPQAITNVLEFLLKRELITKSSAQDTAQLLKILERRKQHWMTWLLHRYLFFRVPLWRCDSAVEKTLPMVRWLGSRSFVMATLLALVVGLIQLVRQWDTFTASLVDMFSLQGLLAYGVTLAVAKFIHELGHAYTAKQFGCRVPAMGIAFLVMFPMPYTDVNDVWRLTSRRQRLLVGAAGIRAELTIAAWATLLWGVLPAGPLQTAAFLLATTTWISTLLVNASPFLRFDGYFLVMDALDQPNLHQSSFDMGRWWLRRVLFNFPDPVPVRYSKPRRHFLISFAVLTWLYRVVVFSGIAMLVYWMLPKPLGPLLAAVEIYWFILKPIFAEIAIWIARYQEVISSVRTRYTVMALAALLLLVAIPWDQRIPTQGLLQAAVTQPLTLQADAQLEQLHVPYGAEVTAGAPLATFRSDDLQFELRSARQRVENLQRQLSNATIDQKQWASLPILRADLEKSRAALAGLQAEADALQITAPITGRVYWIDPDWRAGDWLEQRTQLGTILQPESVGVVTYVRQQDLYRIELGDRATFYAESDYLTPIKLKVARIDYDASRALEDRILASTHGGEILVREGERVLVPEEAIYRIWLTPETAWQGDAPPQLRGKLVIRGAPQSWLTEYYRKVLAVVIRESGF